VRYIEKPINLNELKNALQISVSLREKENINKKLVETSISLIKSELALQLISRSSYLPGIMQNIRAASRYIPEDGLFATILLRVNTDISSESVDSFKMIFENIMEKINEITKLSGIWARNKEEFIVHLYADQNSRHLFTEEKLENVCRMILDETVSYFPVFLALGDIVTGIQNVYRTYESAVIAIQRAFYCGYNSIIKSGDVCIPPYQFSSKKINDFSKLLDDEDNQINAEFFIKSLSMDIKRYDTTPVNECKDYYYRLLLELVNASEKYGIKLEDVPALNTDIWAKFLNFSTIFEMESFLLKQINVYYQSIEEKKKHNSAVIAAIKYIHEHYNDENLSIAVISEHTHLSPAYLSFVFKKSTGKTLNKYINDYRVEKAKEMLKSKKNKITDIALKVGFIDSNYFTKVFRKTCGLSPSEYRERYLE